MEQLKESEESRVPEESEVNGGSQDGSESEPSSGGTGSWTNEGGSESGASGPSSPEGVESTDSNEDPSGGSNLRDANARGPLPLPSTPDSSPEVNISSLTQIDFCDARISDSVAEFDQEPFILEELSEFEFIGSASSSDIHIRRGFTNPGRPPSRSTSEKIRDIELEYEEHKRQIRQKEEAEALALSLKKELQLSTAKDDGAKGSVTNHGTLIPPTEARVMTEGLDFQEGSGGEKSELCLVESYPSGQHPVDPK